MGYHTSCIDMVSPWVCLCMGMHLCQKEEEKMFERVFVSHFETKILCVISYFKIRMSKRKRKKKFERVFMSYKKKKKKKKKKNLKGFFFLKKKKKKKKKKK